MWLGSVWSRLFSCLLPAQRLIGDVWGLYLYSYIYVVHSLLILLGMQGVLLGFGRVSGNR